MFTARYELYLKIIFRLVFVFKRVKHSEPFSTRMYAEAKILNKTFSSVHAKFAFHERLTVVCSETIYAQTLLTSGSCIHMLLRTLKKKAKVSFVDAPQILKGHHFGRKVPRFCPIIFLLKASLKIQWVWVWVWVCECVCVWVSECVCVCECECVCVKHWWNYIVKGRENTQKENWPSVTVSTTSQIGTDLGMNTDLSGQILATDRLSCKHGL